MTRSAPFPQLSSFDRLITGITSAHECLDVLFLYEEDQSRSWAQDLGQRLVNSVGPQSLRVTWWNLGDLCHPGVLAGAVSKAMRADVVVVAIRESEGLPLPFYYWVNSWLPHRRPGRSGLVALLGTPKRPNRWSGRLRKYLRAVARYGRMEVVIENFEMHGGR